MRRARIALPLLALMAGLLLWAPAQAVQDRGENISQSYGTDSSLEAGTIVSTLSDNADFVEAANTANASRIIGVVVKPNSSLVAVDPDSLKAQVATSGTVSVLVSTVNGAIKAGDKIAASPFSGIGMKALGQGYIVGAALGAFNNQTEGATSQQVTDKNGTSQNIQVGYVQVNLSPRFDSAGSEDLSGLQQFVRSLTGHKVSTPRIIISLIIAVLTIVAIIVLIYAGIYGSIISIGRNPLARASIFRALARVLAMALMAFAVAFTLIYFLLR